MGLSCRIFQLTRRQELARRGSCEAETSTLERTLSIMLTARQKTSGEASSSWQSWSSQAARLSLCCVAAMAPHVTAQLQQDTGRVASSQHSLAWWRAGYRTARIQADSGPPPLSSPPLPSLLATVCVTKSDTAHTPPPPRIFPG